MQTIKTSELTGTALDWAVAMCEGLDPHIEPTMDGIVILVGVKVADYFPSTNWSQGGPIIEREKVRVQPFMDKWIAHIDHTPAHADGPTPLIAAMRCYVASKLGDTVNIPAELTI